MKNVSNILRWAVIATCLGAGVTDTFTGDYTGATCHAIVAMLVLAFERLDRIAEKLGAE